MKIVGLDKINEFILQFRDAESSVQSWYYEAKNADWNTPVDVIKHYGTASILKEKRVVFNIKGNKYRLIVRIDFERKIIQIRWIGKHDQYDKIDAETI